jgi:type 2 lantibiotic biosynthesis protein LanM
VATLSPVKNSQDEEQALSPLPLPAQLREHGLARCLRVIGPLIEAARTRVRSGAANLAKRYTTTPFDPEAVEPLFAVNLAEPLLMMMTRVMALELNVARLQGLLSGDTPEERFVSFLDRLEEPEIATQLMDEYPVMVDQVVHRLDTWSTCSREFLEHLCHDWDLIRERLLPADPGLLVEIQAGAGDTHRGGRSVMIASFASGARIVYKPRSLAVDEHFQYLLAWLNELGARPEFRILNVIDRGDHGWTEFVEASPCATTGEISRFYERQGGYLAILYALEASDFHCENLLASGEHPVLIDLEALFHPRLENGDAQGAQEAAGSALNYSVLRIGLLPTRIWGGEDYSGVDMSGLGSAAGQLSPNSVPHWERIDTDEMHVVRKRVEMPGAQNRPMLDGREVNAQDYLESIAAGFASMYRLILDHRRELLGLLHTFADDVVRVIVRGTFTYGTLLHESFHPDVLRKQADRLALFDRLREVSADQPSLARVLPAELNDLMHGDVPLFTTRLASRDLWTSCNERIENYFEMPGLARAQRHLMQLGEKDLEQQLWIARASIATLATEVEGPKPNLRSVRCFEEMSASQAELISAAKRIGDRLVELAVTGGDDATWIGLTPVNEREWRLAPLGPDLYDGLPGVILFLAHLGALSAESRYTRLAQSAFRSLRLQIEHCESLKIIGAFNGWGGLVFSLAHLGVVLADESLFSEAEALLDRIESLVEGDKYLDIIGGAAGCALAMRSLHACKPSARTREVARACGEHLLRTAQHMQTGISWDCGNHAAPYLTGFAHGNAGIAYALLELAALCGERHFASAAHMALAYERSIFSPQNRNWPDLRINAPSGFASAWCHGASGIGLARLCSLRLSGDPVFAEEIHAAMDTTIRYGFGSNHAICHGDLGNAEILRDAAESMHEPEWRHAAERVVASSIEDARGASWICGNPHGIESPGLMTGLAGIGYTLLRFAVPGRVPSILALASPVLR